MDNSQSPILHWNDVRLLQALEVVPAADWEESTETYDVKRGGLGLAVTVGPLPNVLHISLRTEPGREPITSFFVHIFGAAEYISDRRGQFLECQGCFLAADEYAGPADDSAMRLAFTMQVFVKPRIEVRFA